MNDRERRGRLIVLWLQRPPKERTRSQVRTFYDWLEKYQPELLKREQNDPYQQLKSDLSAFIQET